VDLKSKKHADKGVAADDATPEYARKGTATGWYRGRDLTDEEREVFRKRSRESQLARIRADNGLGPEPLHPIYRPRFNPTKLMRKASANGLRSLSLFSGGGGLDLGFERAGFEHVASYDLLSFAGDTLRANRPTWKVFSGSEGDVTKIDWSEYRNEVDVVHGGPPCQPFSSAGHQNGADDARDMFPEFVRAVLAIRPRAFIAENVKGLKTKKFEGYLNETVLTPLGKHYEIVTFTLDAAAFGVPQSRTRFILVGFTKSDEAKRFRTPAPTHVFQHSRSKQMGLFFEEAGLPRTMRAREALGLPDLGFDALCPTLRSSLTGPRHTTSILSSTAALAVWEKLQIWPNGVAITRDKARAFVANNGHYRLSVPEVALLQGFPESWTFSGAAYQALGLIGNSVAPPMAYHLAKSLAASLSASHSAAH
jgi:DNA (cytosine-5)-methyltransferase 1